ncbi:MAG: 2-hydroxyacid dehydrogenase [Gammaproteobacteria bacterium]
MSKPRIIVTRRWPAAVEDALGERFDAVLNPHDTPFTADDLRAALRDCDALCPTVSDRLDASVLGAPAPRARLLANYGVGFNHIDLAAARAAGLAVTNTPDVLTDCTADLALTLLLMTARRAGEGEREVRRGAWTGWRPTHLLGARVTGRTLGLIGFGRIARAVARRAHHGFGMRVLFHDPLPVPPALAAAVGATACAHAEDVLRQADFVSLHCPAGPTTRHLMNAARLACMPPHAILVNTARGDVVDQAALADALRAGRLAGAGLDVYEGEPEIPTALATLENVVLLPHLGSATRETREAMGMRVLENLRGFFDGTGPRDRVD